MATYSYKTRALKEYRRVQSNGRQMLLRHSGISGKKVSEKDFKEYLEYSLDAMEIVIQLKRRDITPGVIKDVIGVVEKCMELGLDIKDLYNIATLIEQINYVQGKRKKQENMESLSKWMIF